LTLKREQFACFGEPTIEGSFAFDSPFVASNAVSFLTADVDTAALTKPLAQCAAG